MNKIGLKVLGISYTHSQSTAYALIMSEVNGLRRLPIVIGISEAQSIALELEKMKALRPLTHDLFKSFSKAFNIELKEVLINKFEEGVFYSIMTFFDGVEEKHLDARTSDAVAIALRFDAPIYTYEKVLELAGINIDSDDNFTKKTEDKKTDSENNISDDMQDEESHYDFSKYSLKELHSMLDNAIEEEAFEKASHIRDEINKRKKKK